MKRQGRAGFTIVELLIVIVVIGILAAITIIAFNGVQSRAKTATLQSDIENSAKSLAAFKLSSSTDSYPANLTEANLKATSPNTYQYTVDNTASPKTYCLSITAPSFDTTYYVNQTGVVQAGLCPGHINGVPAGIVAWYKLNGDATDSSGNGYNGTVSGQTATTGQNGQPNSALLFDGTTSITIPNTTGLLNSSTLTVSAWFNQSRQNNEQSIIRKDNQVALNFINGYARFLLQTNGGTTGWTTANDKLCSSCSASTWALATMTWNGSTESLYINGTLLHSASVTGTINTTNNTVVISPNSSNFFGSLDDIRIYNRTLSANEVAALYSAGAQ